VSESEKHLSQTEISAFVDGELSADHMRKLQAHTTSCHVCALHVISALQLKAISIRASQVTVPPEALVRLKAHLRSETNETPATVLPFRPWAWGALAASLILAAMLFGWRATYQPVALQAELLDQHLAVLSSASSPEVISTDRHTVKPWFDGKLPFSFNLPDTYPPGTVLKGGDLAFLHGQPAALLLFTVGKHPASVFLTQHALDNQARGSSGTESGFTIQSADAGELHVTAISDVNPSDLARLVSSLVSAQSDH
jgi:anti-sigma factor RsiW